jgi:RimJ/RimL family protein N-acetyltransferase
MKRALLRRLFASGATRVLAECYLNNVPSVRTLLRLGFRAVGVLTVVEAPLLRGFVRWERADVAAELARLGIGREAPDAVVAAEGILAAAR